MFSAATALTFAQDRHIGADYGARDPLVCKDKKDPARGAPSAAQAAEYVTCEREHLAAKKLFLIEDVKVEVGAGRPFNMNADPYMSDIDPKFPVYPIRGSYNMYQCEPQVNNPRLPQYNNVGKNCSFYVEEKASGKCWKTAFGDWRCDMTFDTLDPHPKRNVAPPAPKL
jgi:hypothetical protein